MKRLICVCIVAILLLAACATTPITVDVTDAASLMHGSVTFVDIMSDMETAGFCRLFALSEQEVVSAAGYVSTGATAEELFVIEVVDGQIEAVQKAVDEHIQYYIEGYTDYGPQEVPKLKNAVIETHGNYIFLCVCDDPSQAKTAISQILGN